MKRHFYQSAIRFGQFLTLLLLLATAAGPQEACGQKPYDRTSLVVVLDDNYPPYTFRDSGGTLRGILPDQWVLWEQKTGVKVDLKAMNWTEAQRLMREGRADVIDTIFYTDERAKLFDFTPSYARIEVPVYAHKTLGGISDVLSLKGFTVGVKAGDAVIDYLTVRGIDSLKEYPSYEALILAAKKQEIKVFSVDQPAAVYFLYKHGIAEQFRESFVLYKGDFHRAVQKGRADLLHLVQDGFNKISRREYRAIDRKWTGTPFQFKDLLRQWSPWIIGVVAAILLLALGNVFLVRRIHDKTAALQNSEKALRESHELFLLFMRHSPIFIYIKEVTATQSRVLMASDNFKEMIGIPGPEMLGKSMEELFPKDFAAKITEDDKAVVAKGNVLKMDEELHGRYYTTIKFPIVLEGKHLLAGYTIDITDRKRAEEAMAEAVNRYDLLAEQNGTVTWEVDLTGRYINLSDATFATAQYRPEELTLRTHFYDLHPEKGREEFKVKMLGYLEKGEPFRNVLHPVTTKSGGIAWFVSSSIPLRNAQGNLRGAWGTSTDITERIRAEDARRESERKYRILTETMKDVVWIVDVDTLRFLYISPSVEKLLGYIPEEVKRGTLADSLVPDQSEKVRKMIREHADEFLAGTITSETFFTFELIQPRKNGTHVITEAVARFWLNPQTGDLELHGSTRDITERKHAEEENKALLMQLVQAQKLESIGRLAGGVAHDFNNMLQVILGYTEMALEQVPAEQPLHEDLLEIKKTTQRSTNLTRQLLTFARKQVIEPKALNVNETVEDLTTMLRRLIGEGIHLEWKPGRDVGTVLMDAGQFDQILVNLCINSRDAIGKSGHITIETSHLEITSAEDLRFEDMSPGTYVVLSIRDDGHGMAPEILERIFEPLFTTKPPGQGTGLGLSMVYGIVKQNGGHIRVDSEPGKGALFQIFLPHYTGDKTAPEIPAVSGAPASVAKETILLVDDEESILLATGRLLESYGYQVLSTNSPLQALRLFEEQGERIDLLITDVVLPDMSGPELVRQLLQLKPNLKHAFMSGHAANLLEGHALCEKDIIFIQKPCTRETLAKKVQEALTKK